MVNLLRGSIPTTEKENYQSLNAMETRMISGAYGTLWPNDDNTMQAISTKYLVHVKL